ncbi:MAG: ABC transporter permease subunit [Deinococcota bacterium]
MQKVRAQWPLLATLMILFGLGYPLALLFGLPLARRDMQDLRKWTRASFSAASPDTLADEPVQGLSFGATPERGILIFDGAPVEVDYNIEGNEVRLEQPLSPSDIARDTINLIALGDGIYSIPDNLNQDISLQPTIYIDGSLVHPGSVETNEVPDGQRTTFTFDHPDTSTIGRLVVDDQVVDDYDIITVSEAQTEVMLAEPPAFGSSLQAIQDDYMWLNETQLVFNTSPAETASVQAIPSVMRLAEQLQGEVDGSNQVFNLARGNVLEQASTRRLFVGSRQLDGDDERPDERVDGETSAFTFASDTGLISLDGVLLTALTDFTRDGNVITLLTTPARNARLRQHPDYLLTNPSTGQITLAQPPTEPVWTNEYSYYAEPSCGNTVLTCFFALPQHPVPFPHWIIRRAPGFVQKFPVSDERNVLRAVLYTSTGTLVSLALGGLLGTLLAVVFVLVRPLEQAVLPWVIASQTVPIIALVPVLLLVLGNLGITIQTSLLPTALIGAYITFFPVTVGTVKGLRSVDPLALDLMTSYAASPVDVFLKLRFPAAVPFFFTSLKLGAAAALVGALVAETESNNARGLGFQILGQVQSGNVADVWLLLLTSGLLGIILVNLVGLIERLVAPWLGARS